MKIQAQAKINLYLDVIDKRTDGYHELISLMCNIGIHDTVRLFCRAPDVSPGIAVTCDHPEVPSGPDNLAWAAAAAFFSKTGIPARTAIDIHKQIPVGAGLGGGSSDAAAVLTGLNTCYDHPLSFEAVMELGGRIGADVPFFIFGRPAVATGIGEKLSAFSGLPALPLVLIYPGSPVSTAVVYKKFNLALTKTKKIHTNLIFKSGWEAEMPGWLYNALEPVAMQLCPDIRDAKQALLDCGAAGALMSGSGSSVFGLFSDAEQAGHAFDQLSAYRSHWQVFQTRLVT